MVGPTMREFLGVNSIMEQFAQQRALNMMS
jgi:hypothetical protein